ncbi:hypothetical protein DV515_00016935, partial [Chloebia gouldiae]
MRHRLGAARLLHARGAGGFLALQRLRPGRAQPLPAAAAAGGDGPDGHGLQVRPPAPAVPRAPPPAHGADRSPAGAHELGRAPGGCWGSVPAARGRRGLPQRPGAGAVAAGPGRGGSAGPPPDREGSGALLLPQVQPWQLLLPAPRRPRLQQPRGVHP